eukprot:SM000031S11568  [mRNA]  locus=s31:467859:470300:+ [translate_table: standard]
MFLDAHYSKAMATAPAPTPLFAGLCGGGCGSSGGCCCHSSFGCAYGSSFHHVGGSIMADSIPAFPGNAFKPASAPIDNGSGNSFGGGRSGRSAGGGGGGGNRQAALEFVLELAGPARPAMTVPAAESWPSAVASRECGNPMVLGDELPLPAFAIGPGLACTMWNRRMAALSGWPEADALAATGFPAIVLAPPLSLLNRSCDDMLRSVLAGAEVAGEELLLRTRDGRSLRVLLFASPRPGRGAVCVLVPLPAVPAEPIANDGEEEIDKISSGTTSPSSHTEPGTPTWPAPAAAAEHLLRPPSSPTPSASFSPSPRLSAQLSLGSLTSSQGGSTSSLDRIDEGQEAGSSPASMALVMDSLASSRRLLMTQLERCGLGVATVSTAKEAAWRFRQSLLEPPCGVRFNIVLLELQAASSDGFKAVLEIRRLEKELMPKDADGLSDHVLIVAVTNMNRWDLAGMDTNMDKGISAGVDAYITRHVTMQQLKVTLRRLGVRSKYLDVPTSLPRALSGTFHNPLNLSR